jgi:hypothetical protein
MWVKRFVGGRPGWKGRIAGEFRRLTVRPASLRTARVAVGTKRVLQEHLGFPRRIKPR